MLYLPSDIPVLKYLEEKAPDIRDEFLEFYKNNEQACTPVDMSTCNTPPTRFGYYGAGQNIIVYNNKESQDERFYEKELPVMHSIITETKNTVTPRFVYYAIIGPSSGCTLHNDVDYEFKTIKGKQYRLLRTHIPIKVPPDCYFVHLFKKLPWKECKVWAFDEVDLHYSKNDNPDEYRIMVEYDFLYEKDRIK
jgi:hypothetical protein